MFSVLIVDDDEDILLLAEEFLSREDPMFRILPVKSVQEALTKLVNEKVDVVVSDYQMPGTNGIEFLEQLRREYNDIPFIMFTGRASEELVMKALRLGADYYVKKGGKLKNQFAELAHLIRSVIKYRFAEQELLRAKKALLECRERSCSLSFQFKILKEAFSGIFEGWSSIISTEQTLDNNPENGSRSFYNFQ